MIEWLTDLEWARLVPELLGKALGFLLGFAASWFLLFRKQLNALQRLKRGDSDDIIFQMHKLWPIPDEPGQSLLLFRNVAPKTTLEMLYDNVAAQKALKGLADNTTLGNPILQTHGALGFEMLNDAAGHIAGLLATTPFPRETWLFVLTCEDREIVRKKCIRCFLIKPADLELFADWSWCQSHIQVESPWHWFRIVALHRIAQEWQQQESEQTIRKANDMPLVNSQVSHNRIRKLSLGINQDEKPVRAAQKIAWPSHIEALTKLGLKLETEEQSK